MDQTEDTLLYKNKNFYHAVQPILNVSTNEIYGYEALLRSNEITNPELLFKSYKEKNLLFELDMSSIQEACMRLTEIPNSEDALLFINIFPSTLVHPSFHKHLKELQSMMSIKSSSIVFEINEAEKEKDLPAIKKVVADLKKEGYLIALDDVGGGESSFQTLLELDPDIVKIDRTYASNLASSPKKQKLIQLLLQLFGKDIPVVLEGIETKEDNAKAKEIGVPFVQGYYFGKPNRLEYYLKKVD
ncbi:EAL domain, c-di-GMP-specific phosphodiesterase class I (or its enzymatically inactive variant) [Oceanobacillus limi]|uniref:EAL domain, c-di-GMP-specific phosphodiesterase class I (Or its enzymatically inactive variant) n=1 Tax=Oceanobacillus limi TaxID=930131 RepID=A0A1I0BM00_9BACI|nr:EAL domain-containing protein [Oceanobacillus limi]SET08038.1 EAL domain, c-di-GMP-specific phosphodiesterase class I (or its enzymatically inactive variant) [Oceanobacillus limi]